MFWISFLQKILEDGAPESAQKNINLDILRNLEVICPPINLQYEFEKKINAIIEMKEKITLGHSESLFSSLLQEAFG
jgi:type I restriction enzyme S subunit